MPTPSSPSPRNFSASHAGSAPLAMPSGALRHADSSLAAGPVALSLDALAQVAGGASADEAASVNRLPVSTW